MGWGGGGGGGGGEVSSEAARSPGAGGTRTRHSALFLLGTRQSALGTLFIKNKYINNYRIKYLFGRDKLATVGLAGDYSRGPATFRASISSLGSI